MEYSFFGHGKKMPLVAICRLFFIYKKLFMCHCSYFIEDISRVISPILLMTFSKQLRVAFKQIYFRRKSNLQLISSSKILVCRYINNVVKWCFIDKIIIKSDQKLCYWIWLFDTTKSSTLEEKVWIRMLEHSGSFIL